MLSLRASEGGSLSKKIQLNVHLQSVPYHGSSVAYILVAHSSFNIELLISSYQGAHQFYRGIAG